MSPRRWPLRIEDMIAAIREIAGFVEGMSFDDFAADARTQRAVLADFIILGEAVAALPVEVMEAHPEIPWRVMKRMRNTLVHAYFAVDPRIVWETAQRDLPGLLEPLEVILRDADCEDS